MAKVEGSRLPAEPSANPTTVEPQHLVQLISVEEDGLGEELEVIWEVEPGVATIEGYGLPEPTGFDDPPRLDAFLHAVRWGAISSADPKTLQAPFRSGIEIEDYQLDPLVRAIQMPRANLLVADDVGLGKTIEAGLVVQEFLTRHRARTVLVVCPSALQVQWQEQLREKFGLEFRIVNSELLKELRRHRGIHVNPWTHFPRLITSIDYLKRPRPMRLMREVLPIGKRTYPRMFDILIVDEAHNVAPSGRGKFAIDSQRTRAIRALAPHFEHKLFLTATPHNGYRESFSALLELLDDQRFHRGAEVRQEQLAPVMVRRLKSELPDRPDGTPRAAKRVLEEIRVPYTKEEREIHSALQEYTDVRRQAAADRNREEGFATEFVLKLLKKRLFSSPAGFKRTLEQHRVSLATARRKGKKVPKPSLSVLLDQASRVDEEYGDDDQLEQATSDALEASTRLFAELSAGEERLLERMETWARKYAVVADTKAKELLAWIERELCPGGKWGAKRAIIFTEYRDTLRYLNEILASEGLTQGDRVATMFGGMNTEQREAVKASFQASPEESPVRILLATDAASEGINLQNHCSRLIHYEIPWNPNRMEQRNGRVDRYGQREREVWIYHFVDEDFQRAAPRPQRPGDLGGDLEFLYRAVLKLEQMESDLFGKVAPVVARQVEEAMLGRRTRLETEEAQSGAEPIRKLLRVERDLAARVAKLREQLSDTQRDLEISPEHIKHVVDIALDLAKQPPLREATLKGGWPDKTGERQACPVFWIPKLKGSWRECTKGLAHPHTGVERPITFDPALARGRDDVVLAHLNHRLVEMSLRLLRAEVWASDRLHRFTARVCTDSSLEQPIVLVVARLVIVGGDGGRLHEEILTAGGLVSGDKLRRIRTLSELERWSQATGDDLAPQEFQATVPAAWAAGHREALRDYLDKRASERFESQRKVLEQRAQQEAGNAEAILQELQATIQSALKEPSPQTELFDSEERLQVEEYRDSLERRLKSIPEEIEREREIIARRFADPEHRVFPVAVTYLVPATWVPGR